MPLTSGTRLGPYEIVSPLGVGGMGEVYRAKDTRLDRLVAIKVLPSHLSADSERQQRFEREARAISALNHPHICTLYEFGDAPNPEAKIPNPESVRFLVMELVEGESLADRLTKGPLPIEQALQRGIEIADALASAHRQGIVHRDLKPANIILSSRGPTPARSRDTASADRAGRGRYADAEVHVKLLDFGLAKLGPPAGAVSGLSGAATLSSPVTGQGTILGTLQYMAPEQLEGQDADARSDIFAFGSVLYEMITGRKAFQARARRA